MKPESQKPSPQPALAAVGEVGGRIPPACLGNLGAEGNQGAATPNPIRAGAFGERVGEALARRGLELMAEHHNRIRAVHDGVMPVEDLIGFTQGLSQDEWDLMVAAEMDAMKRLNRAGRHVWAVAYGGDPVPVGRR